jgi:large subunit ribosomal protein L21
VFFQARERNQLLPTWFWILVLGPPIFLLLRWLIWWFFSPSFERTSALEINAPRSDAAKISIPKDDFSQLKGIGPKSAQVLYQAGIFSYKQLGLYDTETLVGILKENSLPSGNVAFWQQQASLAAAGKWDQLEELQG